MHSYDFLALIDCAHLLSLKKKMFGKYLLIAPSCSSNIFSVDPLLAVSLFFNVELLSTQQRRSCCGSRFLVNHLWDLNLKFSQIIISILCCLFLTELKGSVATDKLDSY